MTRSQRTLSNLLLMALVVLFVWTVSSVLIPVALGALAAVILYPLQPRLQARLGRLRPAAPGLLLAAASVGLLLPVVFVVFSAVHTVRSFAHQDVDELRASLQESFTTQAERLAQWGERFGVSVDGGALRERAVGLFERAGRGAGEQLGQALASTPDMFVGLLLFMCALYAFLAGGTHGVRWLKNVVPFAPQHTDALFEQVHQAVRGVVLGSILTGLVQSGLCLLALVLLHVPGAFVWSVAAFLLSFLPMLGTTPVTGGATLYLMLSGSWWQAGIMMVAAVIIGTVDNAIRPLVQGAQSDLHPLLALMAIFGGLQVMGPAGIFLGPVIAAMAQWAVETYGTARGTELQLT